jgi:AcrR family transcriptional regulator
MENISKGESTRLAIIDKARLVFNERGIGITLDAIAQEMGMTKSRISNHFNTKDALFGAILKEYEEELAALMKKLYASDTGFTLQTYVNSVSSIMDAQFKYRCGIIYLNMLSPSQHELKAHIRETYVRNQGFIRARMQNMIALKLLTPNMLEEPNWSAFLFVYVNLLTQWVIHLDMYDSDKPYDENKANYIRGIITHIYLPYFTSKGKKEFEALEFGGVL